MRDYFSYNNIIRKKLEGAHSSEKRVCAQLLDLEKHFKKAMFMEKENPSGFLVSYFKQLWVLPLWMPWSMSI